MDEPPAYSPQALHDLLPIYRPPNATADHIHTYTLLQTSLSTQTLCSSAEEETPSTKAPPLQARSFKTGGFMNRKPHIIISRLCSPHDPRATSSSGRRGSTKNKIPSSTQTTTAEARFDIHGTGTSILYPAQPKNDSPPSGRDTNQPIRPESNGAALSSSPSPSPASSQQQQQQQQRTQRLELEDSRLQTLRTAVHGMPAWWQPLPGNRDVLELTNEWEDVIARFVLQSSSPVTSSSSSPLSSTTAAVGLGLGVGVGAAGQGTQTQTTPTSSRIGGEETSGNGGPVAATTTPTTRSNSVFSIGGISIGTITNGGGMSSGGEDADDATTQFQRKSKKQNQKKPSKFQETIVGHLHVVDALVGSEAEREEILCSAIVVVERTRRRRAILERKLSGGGGGGGGGGSMGVGRNGVPYIPQ